MAVDAGKSSNAAIFLPIPEISAGHGSPVSKPHPHDVLSGRGMRIISHPGNVRFRERVELHKREYLHHSTKKIQKHIIAAQIVAFVRSLDPPGRFLKENSRTELWEEIGDKKAWKKAGQALREGAPQIRAERQTKMDALAMRGIIAGANPSLFPGAVGGGREWGGGGNQWEGGLGKDPPGNKKRPSPPDHERLDAAYVYQSSQKSFNDLSSQSESNVNSSNGSNLSSQQGTCSQQQQQYGKSEDSQLLAKMHQEWQKLHSNSNPSYDNDMLLNQNHFQAMMLQKNVMQQMQQNQRFNSFLLKDKMQSWQQQNRLQSSEQQKQEQRSQQRNQVLHQDALMQRLRLQNQTHCDDSDTPGLRNRPTPPDREGLATASSGKRRRISNDDIEPQRHDDIQQRGQPCIDDDTELVRMRAECLRLQDRQQEQLRLMQRYQCELGGGDINFSYKSLDSNEECQQCQQELTNSIQHHVSRVQAKHAGKEAQCQQSIQNQGDIGQARMDDDFLPTDAGAIHAVGRGYNNRHQQHPQQSLSARARARTQQGRLPLFPEEQRQQKPDSQRRSEEPCSPHNNEGGSNNINANKIHEAFGGHFGSCDETVSTMSSLDIQSLDTSFSIVSPSEDGVTDQSSEAFGMELSEMEITFVSDTLGIDSKW